MLIIPPLRQLLPLRTWGALMGLILAAAVFAPHANAQDGAALFAGNCASCHKINDKLVGPALRDFTKRGKWGEEAARLEWIRNSQKYLKAHPEDAYAQNLYKVEYNGTLMTAFPDLADGDIQAIVKYITDESAKPAVTADSGGGGIDTNKVEVAPPPFYQRYDTNQWFGIVGGLIGVVVVLALISGMQLRNYRKKVAAGQLDPAHERSFLSRVNPKFVSLTIALVLTGAFLAYSTQQFLNTGVQQGYKPTQPIAYSHKLHAGKYNIQCSYCHTGVERWKSATIPATNICMNCHNKENGIKTESPEIQKIYAARESGQPIQWVRIHNMQDFVYFNHYQHYKVAGIKCQHCHGAIQKMVVVQQAAPMTMGWCINCHRERKVKMDNGYYQAVHKNSQDPEIKKSVADPKHSKLTIGQMGGLECSKCHY